MRIISAFAIFLAITTAAIAEHPILHSKSVKELPELENDTCFAHKFKNRLGKKADEVDVKGFVMSQPYTFIRGNGNDIYDQKNRVIEEKERNDIIHFILDRNDIVRKMTCKL